MTSVKAMCSNDIAPWDGELTSKCYSEITFQADGCVPETTAHTCPSKTIGHVEPEEDAVSSASADSSSDDIQPVPTKKVKRMLRRTSICFYGSSARDVVLLNAVESGCTVIRKVEDADLVWIEATPLSPNFVRQLSHHRVNFFPGMKSAATKCQFAKLMSRVATLYPGEFDFIPKTYALPFDRRALDDVVALTGSQATWVVKPSAGCGGDGIFLTNDLSRLPSAEAVVQEYVGNPLTVGGLKFDFRLYVLVTSVYPLRFYLHREGLGRMAVEPYEVPSKANFHKLNMHLTNYSLNKFSSKFVDNTDALDDAHTTKRRATTVFRQLAEEYPEFDYDAVWADINMLVGKTVGAIAPHLLACAGEIPGRTTYLSRCFQLLGFDVLLDSEFKPHLLEINHHPSLQTDAPIDMYVKTQIVKPLLHMVSLDSKVNRRLKTFLPPSETEVRSWEERFADSSSGWVPCAEQLATQLTQKYTAPVSPLLHVFVEACGGATGSKYDEMSSSRFARLMRKYEIAGAGCEFSIPEIDLIFMKVLQAKTEGNMMDFYDFVDALTGPIGDRIAKETPKGSLTRLHAVTRRMRL